MKSVQSFFLLSSSPNIPFDPCYPWNESLFLLTPLRASSKNFLRWGGGRESVCSVQSDWSSFSPFVTS